MSEIASDTTSEHVVRFHLPADVGASSASVVGEFNDWSPTRHVLERRADGSFELAVPIATGTRYRYRYFLDGERWENDWHADAYEPNEFGGDDSVLDLTDTSPRLANVGAAVIADGSATGPARRRASTTKAAKPASSAKQRKPAQTPAAKRVRKSTPAPGQA